MDPNSRLPDPPVNMVVDAHSAAAAHSVFLSSWILVALFAVYALWDWQRTKSPILPLILFGGAITNAIEPFVDILGGCWHPIIHQHRIFSLMGRPMPAWLLPTYLAYYGGLPMFMYVAFRKGISSRAMWLWFLIPVVADIILEESLFGISGGNLYTYYANQPLRLHTFPIWWSPVNACGVFVPVIALALATPHLRGWRLAIIPFVTPLLYCGAGSLAGYPSFVVINSQCPYLITQLGGVASFLLSGFLVYIGVLLFAADSPYQIRDVLAQQFPRQKSTVHAMPGVPVGAG